VLDGGFKSTDARKDETLTKEKKKRENIRYFLNQGEKKVDER